MRFSLRYSERAEADLADAFTWYQDHAPAVADKFQAQVEAAILDLLEAPMRWSIWRSPAYRRYILQDFPYALIYRIDEHRISIVSLLHQRQDVTARFPEDP